MVNGLNILPSYLDYFDLNVATIGLQTSSVFIGNCIAGLTWGKVTDILGRRVALFWAALITVVAVVLQTAAQDIAMFVVARVLIGFGTGASGVSGPAYLAETLPLRWRAWGLGIFNDCYYVGAYGDKGDETSADGSRWAYRSWCHIQDIRSGLDLVMANTVLDSRRDLRSLHCHPTFHT